MNYSQISKWPIHNYKVIVLFSLFITILMGVGLRGFNFETSTRVYFSKNNADLIAQEEYEKKYERQTSALLAVESLDGKEIFSQRKLKALKELTDSLNLVNDVIRVISLSNYAHSFSKNGQVETRDFIENPEDFNTQQKIDSIKDLSLKIPSIKNFRLSKDYKSTLIGVYFNPIENGETEAKTSTEEALFEEGFEIEGLEEIGGLHEEEQIKAFKNVPKATLIKGREGVSANQMEFILSNWLERYPEFKIYRAGSVYVKDAFLRAAKTDAKTLIPLVFIFSFLCMLLMTRSFMGSLATVVILLFSIVGAVGASSWVGISFTSISVQAPIMILTLAIADCIHVLSSILHKMRLGLDKKTAIIEGTKTNFVPVIITSVTTILGFLSLNFSESPPYRDLGNICAIGILLAMMFALFTLPALLNLLPLRVKVNDSNKTNNLDKALGKLVNLTYNNALVITILGLIISATFGYFAFKNVPSEEFGEYFDESTEFRQSMDFLLDNFEVGYSMEFSIPSGEQGGINNPEYLENLNKFTHYLRDREEVSFAFSHSDLMKSINYASNNSDSTYYSLPKTKQQAAQLMLLGENSISKGGNMTESITEDRSETRIVAVTKKITSDQVPIHRKEIELWQKENLPEYMHSGAVGESGLFALLGLKQVKEMMIGGVYALLIVTLTIMLALRSVRFGLISMLPNLIPVMIAFGIWYFYRGTLNSGLATVFSMTIGIVVDDSVHFLSKFIHAYKKLNKNTKESLKYAYENVGRPLIYTTAILSCGFIIMAQSKFDINSGMAKLTVVTIVVALFLDLIFLPALITLFTPKNK